jgi:hypothetical protein
MQEILEKFHRWLPFAGAAVALLPKLGCPLCGPACASLLWALGLGWLENSGYLLLLSLAVFALALVLLAHGVRQRGWGPLGLGGAGCALVLTGKFAIESSPLVRVGAGLLACCPWNALPVPGGCCARGGPRRGEGQ